MLKRYFSLAFLYNTPGDGGGGGNAAPPVGALSGTPPPAPAGQPPAVAAPAAPGTGTVPPPAAAAPPAGPDRSNWIPPHRLAEEQKKFQRTLATMESKIRTLMGIDAPPDPRAIETRNAILEIMPELKPLLEQPGGIERVLALARGEQPGGGQSSVNTADRRHAVTMNRSAIDVYCKKLNTTPAVLAERMGPDYSNRFARQFASFLESDNTGQLDARFQDGDPQVVEEFIADLLKWNPAPQQRRDAAGVAEQAARARRLPSSGPRTVAPNAAPAGGVNGRGADGKFANKKARFGAMRQALLDSQDDADLGG